ncbi:3-isopropylmalate dehydratase small subunit [Roseomonas chloroacetimidivorans]|uniref:3-isopropylmalate dehydratase small subunit n=1 Tax=Roseomonas chloroacetimidivorans TaxID=1766656 RepID=UPI003C71A7CD
MQPLTTLTAVAAPLDLANVDTDQIAPARFLRRPREEGYQTFLFHDLRFGEDGAERADFVLNSPAWRQAGILVAGENFGGGSSREQAVWALSDYGFRCVLAVSFGDIFFANAAKQGLLLIRQDAPTLSALRRELHDSPGATMSVDLPAQTYTTPAGETRGFDIEASRKRRLLLGLDDIGLTLRHNKEIRAFEQQYRERRPWLYGRMEGEPASGAA